MSGMLAFEEVALRHMARRLVRDASHCDIVAFKDGPSTYNGACYYPPAAVRLENGFSDIVCERHAREAFDRGASILTPNRPDDWRDIGWTPPSVAPEHRVAGGLITNDRPGTATTANGPSSPSEPSAASGGSQSPWPDYGDYTQFDYDLDQRDTL